MLNTTDKIIKHKTGLLNLAEELGNVSKACQVMGMSRDTFYRYKSAVDDGGVEALFERTRRKPNLANRVDQATEDAVKAVRRPHVDQLLDFFGFQRFASLRTLRWSSSVAGVLGSNVPPYQSLRSRCSGCLGSAMASTNI